MKRPAAVRKNARPEADFQRILVPALRAILPIGSIVHHSANERTSQKEQAILCGMGVFPGFADLIIISGRRVLFLECKSPRGKQSPAQKDFEALVSVQGFPYAIVRTVDEALAVLAAHGFKTRIKQGI